VRRNPGHHRGVEDRTAASGLAFGGFSSELANGQASTFLWWAGAGMSKLTIADQMLYATVKLTTWTLGVVTGSGTGFLWNAKREGDNQVPLVVTNKHVLKGCDKVVVDLHLADTTDTSKAAGGSVACTYFVQAGNIFEHPDPDTDLCAFPFASWIIEAEAKGAPLFFRTLNREYVPTSWSDFDSIEEVHMLGCPNGIYDNFNKLPIARRGSTASPLGNRYEGKDQFLIDLACFPGSSGSPIFLLSTNPYFDRAKGEYAFGSARFSFLGVLYAGPTRTTTGEIVLSAPPRFQFTDMMHLGVALRSTKVVELEDTVLKLIAGLP
jgi:hypothetical protein